MGQEIQRIEISCLLPHQIRPKPCATCNFSLPTNPEGKGGGGKLAFGSWDRRTYVNRRAKQITKKRGRSPHLCLSPTDSVRGGGGVKIIWGVVETLRGFVWYEIYIYIPGGFARVA